MEKKKLIKYQIKGKCLRVLFNMYNGFRSRIFYNNDLSEYFPRQNGVRQGENLSPFLLAWYLNDLEDILSHENVPGLKSLPEEIEQALSTVLGNM